MTGALLLWLALAVLFLLPFIVVLSAVRDLRGLLIYCLVGAAGLLALWTWVSLQGGDSFMPGAFTWLATLMTVSFVMSAALRVLTFWVRA